VLKSNSFVFELKKVIENDLDCVITIPTFYNILNNQRVLFLKVKWQIFLYISNTKDFNDEEISLIRKKNQIYINTKSKKISTDFLSDYKKIKLSTKCDICKDKNCLWIYEIDKKNYFLKSETQVRDILSKIASWKILDIWCWNTLYPDIMKNVDIKYLWIDTNPILDSDFNIIKGNFEVFEFNEKFDIILSFRSINHFEDTEKFFEKIYSLIDDWWKIFIIENEAFWELKTHDNIFEAMPNIDYEHHHNYNLDDIMPYVFKYNLKVLSKQSVTADTWNQWFIILEK